MIFIFQSIKVHVGVAFCYFRNIRYRFYLNHPHVLLNMISKENGFQVYSGYLIPSHFPRFLYAGFHPVGGAFE